LANIISLPQLAWHDISEFKITLPDSWQVEVCDMAGANRQAMKPEEIRAAVANPISIDPIRKLARNRKEVAIIFDDMSRITRVAQIVPFVLDELAEAGVPDGKIRFIAALGAHGAMDRFDFVKKLGEKILSRFPVYNHNPFDNCVYIGTTSHGTEVFINAEVMKCDLKIGIGSIVPHIMAGFSGGAKILMPGVASIKTIEDFHRLEAKTKLEYTNKPITGMGIFENNPLRSDMEEAAILAGLDIKIDCIVNRWGETVAVFAGSPKQAYAAGVEEAKVHYLTPKVKDKDIVIANTFAKASELESGLITTLPAVSHKGGDIILIGNAPEGHAFHYLMGPFGKSIGGSLRLQIKLPPNVNHLIILNEYPDIAGMGYFDETDKIRLMNKWDDVLKLLQELHRVNVKVALYPNAEIQYCK
jgi:nickel-dependent lactate racemase